MIIAAVQSGAGRRQRRGDGGAELLNGTPATSDSWLLKDVLRDRGALKASPFPITAQSKS